MNVFNRVSAIAEVIFKEIKQGTGFAYTCVMKRTPDAVAGYGFQLT